MILKINEQNERFTPHVNIKSANKSYSPAINIIRKDREW